MSAEHALEATSDHRARYLVRFGYGYIARVGNDGKIDARNAGCDLHPRELAAAVEGAVDLVTLPPNKRDAWKAAHRAEQARRDPRPR